MPYTNVDETISRVTAALQDAPPAQVLRSRARTINEKPVAKTRRASERPALVWNLPGFGPMTPVRTSFGDAPAQTLRKGDLIRTRAGNFKPIQWLERVVVSEEFISRHPDALPVLIRKGSISKGVPASDVVLSPRQAIGSEFHNLANQRATAAELLGRPGVIRKAEPMITYTLFHLGAPDVVLCAGLAVKVSADDWFGDED